MPSAIRKPLGAALIVIAIAAYAALVLLAAGWLNRLPVLAQAPLYLILGIAWAPLLFPLVRWIETGRFTRGRAPANPAAKER